MFSHSKISFILLLIQLGFLFIPRLWLMWKFNYSLKTKHMKIMLAEFVKLDWCIDQSFMLIDNSTFSVGQWRQVLKKAQLFFITTNKKFLDFFIGFFKCYWTSIELYKKNSFSTSLFSCEDEHLKGIFS